MVSKEKANKIAKKHGVTPPKYIKRFYTEAQVEVALRRARGLKSLAARMLHVTPGMVSQYLTRWPNLNKAVEEARDAELDFVEDKLHTVISRNNVQAIIYFLNNRGRMRGYGKSNTEAPDVRVNIIYADTSNPVLRVQQEFDNAPPQFQITEVSM